MGDILICPYCKQTATKCNETLCGFKVKSYEHETDVSLMSGYGTATIIAYYNIIPNHPDVWFFNRIKVQPSHYGKGCGKDLMIKLCEILDRKKISLINSLNPYGNRDLKSLIAFFEASAFEIVDELCGGKKVIVMIRRPQ
jgi:GNAT superfamily N-acetyltransferase